MRFLLDESADARVARPLREQQHDVTTVAGDYAMSLDDRDVLEIAFREERILITDDRDFGELVFLHGRPHAGVIYFRLSNTTLALRIARLAHVLTNHRHELDRFLVVTDSDVRVRGR